MTETNCTLFNGIFEEIYTLMEDILDNPKYCDCVDFRYAMVNFTDNIRTEDPFEVEDEEDETYFEAGYRDSTVVFYPFNHNEDLPDKTVVFEETETWRDFLQHIVDDIKEKKYVSKALDISLRLANLINTL
jgi:hypothetical protein